MKNMLKNFARNEDGNTVIDWIVLTSGLVLLGVTVGVAISTPANEVATNINTSMESLEPPTY